MPACYRRLRRLSTVPTHDSRRPGLHGYGIMVAIQEASEEVLRAEEGSL